MEIYRDIPNYEDYQVSNLGNVKSLKGKKERVLKSSTLGAGYLKVALCKNGKSKTFTVHKLVAMAFLNHTFNGFKGLIIDHKNAIKSDNRLENLQLISQRLNASKDRKGTSKYTGVSWYKACDKWQSHIIINGKIKHLGYFTNEIEASNEYQKALKNHLKTL
tara:strand:- start:6393 stop:6878 length:486 start_codon:yes stop_codon:yes gene_type:complete